MTCFHPMTGYRSRVLTGTGKQKITFDKSESSTGTPLILPCGQCIGCRLQKSATWATRCVHEASQYENNCFITLTYDDGNLPDDLSLNERHFQLFMKRLRKKFGNNIRYYHSGEYGEATIENNLVARPHYHAALFNIDFGDKQLWTQNEGIHLYTSETLDELWQKGFTTTGQLTFESAAYVARYVMKKKYGDQADEHYKYHCPIRDRLYDRKPEYSTMSNGIGSTWYNKFKSDIYPSDNLILNGKKVPTPSYYDALLETEDPELLREIKSRRRMAAKKHKQDQTPDRLETRERVTKANLNHFTKGKTL